MSPPAASRIPRQRMLLLVAVVLLALTGMANGAGTTCQLGTHFFMGGCVSYVDGLTQADSRSGMAMPMAPFMPIPWLWAPPGSSSQPLTGGQYGVIDQPATVFDLAVAKGVNSDGTWVLVGELEGEDLTGTPHGEFEVPFTQTFTAKSSGRWVLVVRNWAGQPDSVWDPATVTGSLRCVDDEPFDGIMPMWGCPPLPTPIPEGKCQYHWIGFNPLERWNVFTLARPISQPPGMIMMMGIEIEGRLAAAGNILNIMNSKVHTKPEKWISASDSKWSVSAAEAIANEGEIQNGWIEAIEYKGEKGIVPDGEIVTGQALSVDLAAVSRYFTRRSAAWKTRPTSVVNSEFITADKTLKVRLHGKVNFLNVTGAQLLAHPKVVLTGHPLGTLIINVDNAQQISLSNAADIPSIFVENTEGTLEAPTFGRVLFNFFNCPALIYQIGGPPHVLHASILAPVIQQGSFAGLEVHGNIVVSSGMFMFGKIALAPFGMMPKAPKPAGTKWTSTGKKAVGCLWHEL